MLPDGIRGVCFDIGGTLTRMDRGALAPEIARLIGADVRTVRDLMIEHGQRHRTTAAELAEVTSRSCGRPDAAEAVTALIERRRREIGSPVLYPDAVPVLQTLRQDGWRVFYLSNAVGFATDQPEPAYFSFAEAVLHSWQTGWHKPEREAFRAVEVVSGLSPRELVCVGNSRGADIVGALHAGWSAVHVARSDVDPRGVAGVPVIDTLAGLPELLPARRGGPVRVFGGLR